MSFGVYPDVGLKDAREKREEARKQLAQGIDPGDHRKAAKATASGADSFEHVAREWHARHMANKSAGHAEKDERPMSENTVLGALRRMGYTTDDLNLPSPGFAPRRHVKRGMGASACGLLPA
ncbi:MAG: DUF4102 domain-containing protein [Methylococcaceae bacterium]|nr:MAG: DUF4102 domain-containing protein [Methylococcaceae bacterium]